MGTIKIDTNTIEVTKSETKQTKTEYDYGFLKQQLINIQKQKNDFDALRDAELTEVRYLIAQADALGVVEADKVIP